MSTKLTLRLDEKLIRRAKIYSKKTGKSLSQLVADYFTLLDTEISIKDCSKLPPITRSLLGVMKCVKISEADYKKYLLNQRAVG